MSKGLKIPAFFKAKERLAEMRWVRRQVKITDGEGRILEEMSDVEAPESWSQQAVNIVARQYFRHSLSAGAPERSVARQPVDGAVRNPALPGGLVQRAERPSRGDGRGRSSALVSTVLHADVLGPHLWW